jgi:hypothetical protein
VRHPCLLRQYRAASSPSPTSARQPQSRWLQHTCSGRWLGVQLAPDHCNPIRRHGNAARFERKES